MSEANPNICSIHTDMYQITMAYAYWKNKVHENQVVFDMFFRSSPFGGEFAIFAGLSEAISYLEHFSFTAEHIEYLRSIMHNIDDGFFDWLGKVDCSQVRLYSLVEGSICFPREPMVRVEGPLAICQLLETTLLNIINFPSLVTTNAARMRLAVGEEKSLLEFGLRRAQGPDGAMTASRYSYLGGFDATSNVLAGMRFGIPVRGTHAHAFVQAFADLSKLTSHDITLPGGETVPFLSVVLECRSALGVTGANEGELTAFISYAQAFPTEFLALIDTYDTLRSGVLNYCCVAWALIKLGCTPVGVRLDSGDLAYLSNETRKIFTKFEKQFEIPGFSAMRIVASNDINEETLHSLNQQGHSIDSFGIGTHLVTCQSQPALGAVFKLVELDHAPRIKLSNAVTKVSIPAKKNLYRLYGTDGVALIDVLTLATEPAPVVGQKFMCRHPFDSTKRCQVTPHIVEPLLHEVWNGKPVGHGVLHGKEALSEARATVKKQLVTIRQDIKRRVNPTPFKVSVSSALNELLHNLWQSEAPVPELS